MDAASALGYGQITLSAFAIVGVGTEEKCMTALCYSLFTVDSDTENGAKMRAPAALGWLAAESGGER
jgi:hypothetical protein